MIYLTATIICYRCSASTPLAVQVNTRGIYPKLDNFILPALWRETRVDGTGEREYECPTCADLESREVPK